MWHLRYVNTRHNIVSRNILKSCRRNYATENADWQINIFLGCLLILKMWSIIALHGENRFNFMRNTIMEIWGAGLSGLIAASIFPQATVFESGPRGQPGHKALLRFRSKAVADATGVEFKKVLVHKGLWSQGRLVQPNILLANQYSNKVIGRLADRSIWNLDSVERYIAPDDFIDRLVDNAGGRIEWNTNVDDASTRSRASEPVISTIPMGTLQKVLGIKMENPDTELFSRKGITVRRWKIPGADVYQTVYVSDPHTNCYRVSITGDTLIAEYIGDPDQIHEFDPGNPFFVTLEDRNSLPDVKQSFGKIVPIEEAWRKEFIFQASLQRNVFSLGRFGTWRNILLDDVVHDCSVIKRLLKGDSYDRNRQHAGALK
jgi:hypothetical protein